MRLTDEQVIAARDYGRKTGDFTEEALATEVLESRAEIARLTKDRDGARANSDKWLKLMKAAFQQDADSHADFCARVAAERDKP
jgi:hypothetical protein